jgi:sugar O-acyltransferase (sialic acid O-acetyltransferase NeuD family)
MSVDLILIGSGAFAIEVATYISDINSVILTADSPTESMEIIVTDVVSSDHARRDDVDHILETNPRYHDEISSVEILRHKYIINCIGDPAARSRIYRELAPRGVKYWTLVHPTAYVAPTAKVGAGCIICPLVFVGPYAQIGDNVAINVGSTVGHDVIVGRSAVLSPGSRLNGHATCGIAAFLGAGATLLPKTGLGDFSKLSAGSVLTKRVGDGFLMHGNPASGRQMIRVPADPNSQ